jgi:hypothetical protein
MTAEGVPLHKWLVLVHQLPPRPSNLRVHAWRRLQRVGAVALRSALYVLPNTSEAREDFDWIRKEIVDRGGQVNILAALAVDGYTDDELEAAFRDARAADYKSLIADVELSLKRFRRARKALSRLTLKREVAKARERLQAITSRDFFDASGSSEARDALRRLETLVRQDPVVEAVRTPVDLRSLRGRVWVTRPRPGIDRMASAWLIRRFLVPGAEFAFGQAPDRGQIPFDMPDVEFGHHGTECTFETLLRRFGITDTAAGRIGHLVHDLDLKESRYGVAEAPTIGRLVEGIRRSAGTDHEMLEHGIAMMEALYQSFTVEAQPAMVRQRSRRRPQRGK